MLRWMYPLFYLMGGRFCSMQDIRIERWAHTLVHYSLSVKAGETLAIHATPLAAPLVEAVYREVLRVGAYPVPLIELENLEEILLRQGNDAQLTKVSPVSTALVESVDARLSIGSRSKMYFLMRRWVERFTLRWVRAILRQAGSIPRLCTG